MKHGAIDVHDREVDENFERLHLGSLGDHAPVQLKAVRIEKTDCAAIFLVSRPREDIPKKQPVEQIVAPEMTEANDVKAADDAASMISMKAEELG